MLPLIQPLPLHQYLPDQRLIYSIIQEGYQQYQKLYIILTRRRQTMKNVLGKVVILLLTVKMR